MNYGAENNEPNLYYNCYENSATLKSIIDGYVNYILGDDIVLNEKIKSFKNVNDIKGGMTMREFLQTLALDYMIYRGFAFQIIYNKMGGLFSFIPLDFSHCRVNAARSKVYYSTKKWGRYTNKYTEYDIFNPSSIQDTCIFWYKDNSSKGVYPKPLWKGALWDALTEIESSKYSLNSVSNGFSARYLVNIPNAANLTKEQKDLIKKEIKEKYSGNETESNFMIFFANGDKEISVNRVESDDLAERYTTLKEAARSNIYTSLRCTPLLFGLPNASNGFSTQEYKDSFKLFNKTCIKPIQDTFVEALNKVFKNKLGDDENALEFVPFNIDFENN